MWHWYIVILASEDYFTLFEGYEIIRARSKKEAERKAISKQEYERFSAVTFGPFDEKPQKAK